MLFPVLKPKKRKKMLFKARVAHLGVNKWDPKSSVIDISVTMKVSEDERLHLEVNGPASVIGQDCYIAIVPISEAKKELDDFRIAILRAVLGSGEQPEEQEPGTAPAS